MMLALQAKGAGPAAIAREMALELGDGSFAPDLVEHLPGVTNIEADLLSRRYDPAYQPWSVPPMFASVKETELPPRPLNWYLTMGDPPRLPAAQAGTDLGEARGEKRARSDDDAGTTA